MYSSIRNYPLRVDDNVVRAVASLTFLTAILLLLEDDLQFLIYFLFSDFILRYIHPRLSPVARLMKFININLLDNHPIYKFSPPKRFAILIGVVMTGAMTICAILDFLLPFNVFLIFLIIASGLQSWFDYCLGCTLYDYLVKLKILGKGENHDDFIRHLEKLSHIGSITEKNVTGVVNIQEELRIVAKDLDGTLSEEENVLINQITADLNSYIDLLEQALEDGIITSEEKNDLIVEGNNVAKETFHLTPTSARARNYLTMVQDYINYLNRRLIKNWQ